MEPLHDIDEAVAAGSVKEHYEDIKAVVGISVVPLIYRKIASLPDGLEWCWAVLRPLYLSGAVAAAGARVTGGLASPGPPPHSPAVLEAVGVTPEITELIRAILATYHRTNPQNLVAFSTLLAALEQEPPAPPEAPSGDERASFQPPPPAVEREALPPLLTPEEMGEPVVALVNELAAVGRERPSPNMASVYRILARWPGFLALAITQLHPLERSGRLAQDVETVRGGAAGAVRSLMARNAVPAGAGPLPEPHRKTLEAFLRPFLGMGLVGIIPVINVLLQTLPAASHRH